ncbi:MAG: hypothetical protein M3066_00015 [Actinomycetota bacterium]|nr:hypothetical protein [Actinomycetota bacterium]
MRLGITACGALVAGMLVACSSGGQGAAGSGSAPTTSTTTSPVAAVLPPRAPDTSAAGGGATGPAGGPVPDGFTAASVTFVSLQTGWVLGTAPCAMPPCTSLVRTRDGGRTWAGIPAPAVALTGSAAAGVSTVRFADAADGWVFGPELWATHDGGAHWTRTTLPGVDVASQVSDLEAAGSSAHATVTDATGVRILTTPVGREDWTLSTTTVQLGAGPIPQAQLVLHGDSGWVVEVDRTVMGGARLSGTAWVPWQPPCGDAGGSAFLAAPTSGELIAVCNEGEWNDHPRAVRYYRSGDGGTTFREIPVPVPTPGVLGVASGAPGTAVTSAATSGGAALLATFDDGATWVEVHHSAASSSLKEVGFTSANQGVAIEVPQGAGGFPTGSLLMTVDGGHTWNALQFR